MHAQSSFCEELVRFSVHSGFFAKICLACGKRNALKLEHGSAAISIQNLWNKIIYPYPQIKCCVMWDCRENARRIGNIFSLTIVISQHPVSLGIRDVREWRSCCEPQAAITLCFHGSVTPLARILEYYSKTPGVFNYKYTIIVYKSSVCVYIIYIYLDDFYITKLCSYQFKLWNHMHSPSHDVVTTTPPSLETSHSIIVASVMVLCNLFTWCL